jgi:hypothetical protein
MLAPDANGVVAGEEAGDHLIGQILFGVVAIERNQRGNIGGILRRGHESFILRILEDGVLGLAVALDDGGFAHS